MTSPSRQRTMVTTTTTTNTTGRTQRALFLLLLSSLSTAVYSQSSSSSSAATAPTTQQQSVSHRKRSHRVLREGSTTTTSSSEEEDTLWCKMAVFDVLYANEDGANTEDAFYACYPVLENTGQVSDLHYTVQLPDHVVAPETTNDIQNWWLAIPGGSIDDTVAASAVTISNPSAVYSTQTPPPTQRRFLSEQHATRRLASAVGELSVLVVYIRASDAQPSFSQQDVFESVFSNDVSLKWQFHHCSGQQLVLEPTELGVLTVDVNVKANNGDHTALVNAAEQAAVEAIQRSESDTSITNSRQYADLVMYMVPPGTGNWLAYASLGGGMSVYNDEWGIYLAAQAHEVGHNLGLLHGGDGDSVYGDHSSFMGGAIVGIHDESNFPRQCYNAQNHWQLDWYPDTVTTTVDPSSPVLVKVIAFSDYENAAIGSDHVLVRTGQDQDLYMQYNRATGFNADVYDYRDELVIIRDTGGGTWVDGHLTAADNDEDSVYQRGENNGKTLRIEVCSQVASTNANKPDYMVVSVGYGSTLCNQVVGGFGSFTTLQAADSVVLVLDESVCRDSGVLCQADSQCCTNNCHYSQCGGAYADSKDTSSFIIGGDPFGRGSRGNRLRGLASKHLGFLHQ